MPKKRVISIFDSSSDEEKPECVLATQKKAETHSNYDFRKMSTPAEIQKMINDALAAREPRESRYNVPLEKLNMHNYNDWSKKMRSSLKLKEIWLEPDTEIMVTKH